MKKILITGGAGFIGTHLAERLVERAPLVLFDNFRRDSLKDVPALRENRQVSVISGDILDQQAVEAALAGVDTVIHLAAIAGVSSYYSESLRTLQVNILGTAGLLAACAKHKIERFVHFSTSEVFGSDALNVHEESGYCIGPVSDRRWVYATSKLAGEQFTLRSGEQYGFAATVVRPFNIYGPRQTGEGAISNFCHAAVTGQPLEVYGDGTPLRAWCYVSDFVDAIVAILDRPITGGMSFNIGNPTEVETTLGLARRFVRLVPGATVQWKKVERAEVQARVPNIRHAETVLDFQPRVSLDEGLVHTLKWFRERQN